LDAISVLVHIMILGMVVVGHLRSHRMSGRLLLTNTREGTLLLLRMIVKGLLMINVVVGRRTSIWGEIRRWLLGLVLDLIY